MRSWEQFESNNDYQWAEAGCPKPTDPEADIQIRVAEIINTSLSDNCAHLVMQNMDGLANLIWGLRNTRAWAETVKATISNEETEDSAAFFETFTYHACDLLVTYKNTLEEEAIAIKMEANPYLGATDWKSHLRQTQNGVDDCKLLKEYSATKISRFERPSA